jgi:hypothetical protein
MSEIDAGGRHVRLVSFPRPLLAIVLAAAVVSLGLASAPAQPDKPPIKPADKGPAPAADKKMNTADTLPPGTIIGIYENVADALRKHPDFYLIRRQRLQELEDAEKRLDSLLAGRNSAFRTPSKCVLKGKVDGGLALLQAQFEFDTSKPGQIVRLGCGLASATGATLDGRTPSLLGGGRARASGKGRADEEPEGFSVWVEKPGDHTLTLDLILAVSARPPAQPASAQGFVLDLPRAAMTRLEFDLPAGAREVRIGGKPLAETLAKHRNNQLAGTLGAADRLDLSWKPAQAPSASAVLAAEGAIEVRVDDRQVKSRATLTLSVLGGQARQWSLLVPPGADIKPASGDEGRIDRITTTEQKQASLRVIHLKEASASPLTVIITSTRPAPKPGAGKPTPIGPFTVLGAVRQAGNVLISNAVADWHLEFTPHGDLTRRGATDEELRRDATLVAAFRYGPAGGDRGTVSWLDLEAQTVRGQIKTRSAHVLHLATDGDGRRWQVQTTMTITPRWADVDRFSVQIPNDCEFNGETSAPERVRAVHYDMAARRVEFKLTRGSAQPSLQPFVVTIECTYSAPVNTDAPGQASLTLPRALGTIEQDGTVIVKVPASLELLPDVARAPAGSSGLELVKQSTHELIWHCPRRSSNIPTRVDVAWQPYRPPVSVVSQIDLTLAGQEGQVHQELRYRLPEAALAPPRLTLRVPEAVVNSLRVKQGGRLVAGAEGPGGGAFRTFDLRPPANLPSGRPEEGSASRSFVVELEYTFALQIRPGERFTVPLVVPDTTARGETRVRVWSDSGNLPASPSNGWTERNIEEVPGNPRLPVLVLHSSRTDLPLSLRSGEAGAGATALVELALVRVEIGEDGVQSYRVGYRLSRLAGRELVFELPAPVNPIGLTATFNGKRVALDQVAADRPEQRVRLARLRLSADLLRKPGILELSYKLTPDRTDTTVISTTLQAPQLVGEAGGVSTLWQITAPPGWVVISPEAGPATGRTWGWRGWLLAPRSGSTAAEQERWLAGSDLPATVAETTAGVRPTLILWRDSTPTVQLTHAPQLAWLLACSLVLVLLGLMLSRLPLVRHVPEGTNGAVPPAGRARSMGSVWAWLLLSVVVAAVVLGVLLWPTLAGQIAYGCQPGAVVLLLIAGVQWLLHERYRRQLVFLPSFSRSRPGSSQMRQEAARAAHGEPPTIDAPRLSGSSVERR